MSKQATRGGGSGVITNNNEAFIEDDAAHFPIIYALVASLLALWLSLFGPPRPAALKLIDQLEFSASALEKPILALPIGSKDLLVVSDNSVQLVTPIGVNTVWSNLYSHDPTSSEATQAGYVVASRASLLGKTRVSKGRRPKLGCSWEGGAAVVTEVGTIIGFLVKNGKLLSAWEITFGTSTVEAIDMIAFETGKAPQLLVMERLVGNESSSSTNRIVSCLDIGAGKVAWRVDLDIRALELGPLKALYRNSGDFNLAQGAYPQQQSRFIVHPSSTLATAVWPDGSAVLDLVPRGELLSLRSSSSHFKDGQHSIQADIDGDSTLENIQFGLGLNGCVRVIARRKGTNTAILNFNNCTSVDDEEIDWNSQDQLHVVLLTRTRKRAGSTVLLGNLTLNRFDGRGLDIVFLNTVTGSLACLTPDGVIKWNINALRSNKVALSNRIQQRLYALVPGFSAKHHQHLEVQDMSHGADESTAHLLVIGDQEVSVTRAVDRQTIFSRHFTSPLIAQPLMKNSRVTFILEEGTVLVFDVKVARDIAPPLILIPVILSLCSFWACVMWRRLEDV